MNQELGLNVLGRIMDWDDDRARDEFRWLRLIARLKYDGYRDFQAGMRFIESLVTWIQQHSADAMPASRCAFIIKPSDLCAVVVADQHPRPKRTWKTAL